MPGLAVFRDTAGGDIAFGHDLSQSFAYRQIWQKLQQTSTDQCIFTCDLLLLRSP